MNQSTIQSFNKPKIHVDKFHPIEKEGCFVSLYLGLSHLRAHIYEFQCHRPQTLRLPKVPRCEYGRLKNLILISVLFEAIFSSGICEDCEHWGGIFICKSKEIEASPYGAEVRQKWISSVSVHWIQQINSPSCSVSFCLKVCWPFRFAIVDVDDDYVTYDYYDEDEWWCAMTTSMGSNVDHVWTLFCAPLNRRSQCTWMINTSRDSIYLTISPYFSISRKQT